jgi:hypothetical protein
MSPNEKEKLVTFFAAEERWCQEAEARDEAGEAVHYNDPSATAWDITGSVCLLFGWRRALELFPQLDRHVRQIKRSRWWVHNPGITSMAALQDSNDNTNTTFEMITGWLKSMPVWNGHSRCSQLPGRGHPTETC